MLHDSGRIFDHALPQGCRRPACHLLNRCRRGDGTRASSGRPGASAISASFHFSLLAQPSDELAPGIGGYRVLRAESGAACRPVNPRDQKELGIARRYGDGRCLSRGLRKTRALDKRRATSWGPEMVRKTLTGALLLTAMILPHGARAEPMFDWTADAIGRRPAAAPVDETQGWRFDAVSRIIVKSLGFFNHLPAVSVDTLATKSAAGVSGCSGPTGCRGQSDPELLVVVGTGRSGRSDELAISNAAGARHRSLQHLELASSRYITGAGYKANDADHALRLAAVITDMAGPSFRGVEANAFSASGAEIPTLDNPHNVLAWVGPSRDASSISEPGSLILAGGGLLLVAWLRRRVRAGARRCPA